MQMEVLEDEISGLAVEKEKLDRQLHKNHKSDEKVEAAHAALEAEVARFMRSVKQRKHALACEQATISERKRVINEQRAENDAQVRLIQDTLLTLRR
jgi:chromosome segregation ATPase